MTDYERGLRDGRAEALRDFLPLVTWPLIHGSFLAKEMPSGHAVTESIRKMLLKRIEKDCQVQPPRQEK